MEQQVTVVNYLDYFVFVINVTESSQKSHMDVMYINIVTDM
jgi:hypothetical protein